MDIYCPKCGEPWDHDELHYVGETTYAIASADFAARGCAVFGAECNTEHPDNAAALCAQAAMELSDHAGDWASDMDDFARILKHS